MEFRTNEKILNAVLKSLEILSEKENFVSVKKIDKLRGNHIVKVTIGKDELNNYYINDEDGCSRTKMRAIKIGGVSVEYNKKCDYEMRKVEEYLNNLNLSKSAQKKIDKYALNIKNNGKLTDIKNLFRVLNKNIEIDLSTQYGFDGHMFKIVEISQFTKTQTEINKHRKEAKLFIEELKEIRAKQELLESKITEKYKTIKKLKGGGVVT